MMEEKVSLVEIPISAASICARAIYTSVLSDNVAVCNEGLCPECAKYRGKARQAAMQIETSGRGYSRKK